jgi:hypothetical protein
MHLLGSHFLPVHVQKPYKNTNKRQYSSFRRSHPPQIDAKTQKRLAHGWTGALRLVCCQRPT